MGSLVCVHVYSLSTKNKQKNIKTRKINSLFVCCMFCVFGVRMCYLSLHVSGVVSMTPVGCCLIQQVANY
jgi:hypothetical protein